MAFLL
ncbi:hypothetical protein VCHENC01_3636A, partial [Vibrio harveyi]|jgi:hypothetical protein